MLNKVKDLLLEHGLRFTEPRTKILHLFLDNSHALSYHFLENSLGSEMDRVTIYRTLRTFVDSGLLHTIPDEQQTILYAMCAKSCHDGHKHEHNHLHFKCLVCGETTCLQEVNLVIPSVPIGFKLDSLKLIGEGVCSDCQ
jgi:Fur family ferric uptake transcriptional regulator